MRLYRFASLTIIGLLLTPIPANAQTPPSTPAQATSAPTLVGFVEASYPEAALAERRSARVELVITIAADEEPNRVHVSTGGEYGFVAGAGYTRILPFLDRQLVLTGDATLPWASFDVADFRVRAAALVPIVGSERWKLAGGLAPTLRGTHNMVSDMMDLGVDASVVGGFYMPNWFIALEGGADLALTTHVTHSDAYRMNVYADAKDGWFANPGANVRGGVQAGVSFDRYDVILRAGQVRDSSGGAPLLPFYGSLAVDARW